LIWRALQGEQITSIADLEPNDDSIAAKLSAFGNKARRGKSLFLLTPFTYQWVLF